MFTIGEEARKNLEMHIGLPLEQMSDLGIQGEIALVKAKTGKTLQFKKNNDPRKIGRGSPLLALNRITTIEDINAKIDAL